MNETIESVLKQQEFWEKLTEEQQKLILKESPPDMKRRQRSSAEVPHLNIS